MVYDCVWVIWILNFTAGIRNWIIIIIMKNFNRSLCLKAHECHFHVWLCMDNLLFRTIILLQVPFAMVCDCAWMTNRFSSFEFIMRTICMRCDRTWIIYWLSDDTSCNFTDSIDMLCDCGHTVLHDWKCVFYFKSCPQSIVFMSIITLLYTWRKDCCRLCYNFNTCLCTWYAIYILHDRENDWQCKLYIHLLYLWLAF